MIKLIVSGACGKMGQRIIANASSDFKVMGAIEWSGSSCLGKDIGTAVGLGKEMGVQVTDNLKEVIKKCDVIIEFTNPKTTLVHLELAVKSKKAMVIGTTGFSEEQLKKVKKLGNKIPCVLSPNMSLGVNLLFKLAGEAAKILGDEYDIEIVETHHRLKKDAPSGTANKLAQVISESLNRNLKEVAVYGREGIASERKKETIGIMTVRGGDIVGDHTVMYLGTGEKIELSHRATNRDTFAIGALRAAKFVINKPPKLYDMGDVLGLKKG